MTAPDPTHRVTVRAVATTTVVSDGYNNAIRLPDRQWHATCSACPWSYTTAAPQYTAAAAAREHEYQHNPGTRPAPSPRPPAHGIAATRWLGSSEHDYRCHCGQGWTGSPTLAEQAMRAHLEQTSTAAPEPWPTPTPPASPGRPLRTQPHTLSQGQADQHRQHDQHNG